MTATYKIYTVDAFTKTAFSGNQAGVVVVPEDAPMSEQAMQQVASEFNYSDTAFFTPTDGKPAEQAAAFALRWFTPTREIKLCGHATLATAHVLFHELRNPSAALRFATLSGELVVRKVAGNKLEMTFPADPPEPIDPASSDVQTLALAFAGAWDVHTVAVLSPSLRYLVIHSPGFDETSLMNHSPGVTQKVLDAGERLGLTGAIVTWLPAGDGSVDYRCRVFVPWNGVDEDPATGSAQTVLAPFWSQRLPSKSSFASQQCSKRGAMLEASLVGSKVAVSGQAVVVIRGSLSI
ncbi:hypothetical protein IWW48_002731 [Coemansia sp. RSA 1200]|nr:hypothetical protein IWW48_002731 [Coemansia sp. RSA 1200]